MYAVGSREPLKVFDFLKARFVYLVSKQCVRWIGEESLEMDSQVRRLVETQPKAE